MNPLSILPVDIKNPFDGVSPTLNVFGVAFEAKTTLILGGIWAIVLLGEAIAALIGLGKWAWASNVTRSTDDITDGAGAAKKALIAFGATAGIGLLIGAVIWVVSPAA